MISYFIHRLQNITFSELVVKCQNLIRKFASEQLLKNSRNADEAFHRAASSVSQRDIQVRMVIKYSFAYVILQRVFTFYNYLIKTFEALLGYVCSSVHTSVKFIYIYITGLVYKT